MKYDITVTINLYDSWNCAFLCVFSIVVITQFLSRVWNKNQMLVSLLNLDCTTGSQDSLLLSIE